jgi:hypothetical protein
MQGFEAFKLALMQQEVAHHYPRASSDMVAKEKNPYPFQEFDPGF